MPKKKVAPIEPVPSEKVEIVVRDWKYYVKSTLWTFFTFFGLLLCTGIQSLSLKDVEFAFMSSGVVAAARTLARIVLPVVARAAWEATKQLAGVIARFLREPKA